MLIAAGRQFPFRFLAERLGMSLMREVNVPADEKRGEVVASHYEITRD